MFDAKYCAIDGMKIQKGSDFERFGKHFCSEQHAQQYVQEMEKARQATSATTSDSAERKSGGCC